jgi:hypothetical protein
MASTYTDLGLELMATGENAGTWGTKTNANLQLIEQLTGGVLSLSIAGGAGNQDLTIADGALTGTAQHRVIEFTGTISGARVIRWPLLTEAFYLIKNGTTGGHTVQLKAVSGSGATVTFATDDKGYKLVYFDGVATNTGVFDAGFGAGTSPGGSNTQVQFNDSSSFGGDANFVWDASTGLNIGSQKELRLQDSSGGQYIGQKASGTTTSYTVTWPAAVAGGNGYLLKSTTGGVLSWEEASAGGTSWQAVKTTTYTAVAGQGIFANTSGGAWTLTLPSSPTIGDEVSVIDYAGTFDTNNLTIGRNSQNIQGSAADLTVATERAGFTLVFTDGTQGWLLKNN